MYLDGYPKSIKKVIRYIKQDAPLDQLRELEVVLAKSIQQRKKKLKGEVVK
ncbi:hypothetical protein ACQCVB_02740 [Fictibacillus phosphorivorans]|uniref:hypothetical protein n=1 Tax=Fictibacillus phosphorivorans TaxID=1221500 RepID=UPI003CF375B2